MSLSFRPFTSDDYAIRAEFESLSRPDLPTTAESLRHEDAIWPPESPYAQFMLLREGATVGFAQWYEPFWKLAEGRYQLAVALDPEDSGWNEALTFLEHDLSVRNPKELILEARSNEDKVLQAVETLGFREYERTPVTVLDLESFECPQLESGLNDLVAEGLRAISVATLEHEGFDWVAPLYHATSQIAIDIPSETPVTPIPFETFAAGVADRHSYDPEFMHVAMHGTEIIAYTRIETFRSDPTWARTGLTGTLRAYRRRGIATLIKQASILNAKERGVRHIVTDNLENNPMLQINRSLGFRPWFDYICYRKYIEPN